MGLPYFTGKGGRLYRAGFTASGSRISLGSLDTILLAAKSKRVEDIPKTLRLSKVNKYALREKEADDVLVCDIYLDSSSSQVREYVISIFGTWAEKV